MPNPIAFALIKALAYSAFAALVRTRAWLIDAFFKPRGGRSETALWAMFSVVLAGNWC